MEMEITVPDDVPVMTLPNVAFFPQSLMPLHIFEPRYRKMLSDVLATNRIFAIAGLDQRQLGRSGAIEPQHRIAGIGIVRACQKNDNGTSNLLIQGLCRAEISEIISEPTNKGTTPYQSCQKLAVSHSRPKMKLLNDFDHVTGVSGSQTFSRASMPGNIAT